MIDENKSLGSDKTDSVTPNAEEARGPEPLKTYEQMNVNAPVVSAAAIEERLAKKQAEEAAAKAPAAEGAAEESGEEKKSFKNPLGDRVHQSRERRERGEGRGEGRGRGRRDAEPKKESEPAPALPTGKVPVPNIRQKTDDEEAELAALFADNQLNDIMDQSRAVASQELFEESTKVTGKIESIQTDYAYVNIGARELAVIPVKQFPEDAPAEVGMTIEAVVTRYNKEDGLYEISLPLAAAEVGDWSSLSKGMVVEAHITGINKGGLECEVGKLRGFLPLGQMATFRVENPEQFVGETWKCIITEVNPLRRNLVVSRRDLMQKENEEKREKLMAELEVGQVREGLVRKIIDIGAFVDLGGVDGFIHVSQMSWGRVNHPSDVLKEGERIRVTITKINRDNNRISLSFKDASMDPWQTVTEKFSEGAQTRGKVTAIMAFGAFVEIMPGVEGLVHISEISYKRVANVSDALTIGDFVDVKILSIDEEKRKMSLSIKQTAEDPRIAERAAAEAAKAQEEADAKAAEDAKIKAEADAIDARIKKNRPKGPLKGGVSSQSEGSKFGLNW